MGGGWGWWGGGQGGCEHNVGGTGDVGYEGCEPRIEGIVQCTNQRTNGPVNAHLMSCPSKAQNIKKLQKMMLYNPNLDLVNDNVYT